MKSAPAVGERSAARGFRWQYDHIAARVYGSLVAGDFNSLRLTDPRAGQVDDLVLIRGGQAEGYQFKSTNYGQNLTFRQFIGVNRDDRGRDTAPLFRSLADGWKSLRSLYPNVQVHLVMQRRASTSDHVADRNDPDRPSPNHFNAFIAQVLEPIRKGEVTLSNIDDGWRSVLSRLESASGLEEEEFNQFLQSLHLNMGAPSGLPLSVSTRRSDIVDLSNALWRRVSEASTVVELDYQGVLRLVGWQGRPRLKSQHEFPVDIDTYTPLEAAIEKLTDLLQVRDGGYIGVVGPPGSGKSTLLSQALTGSVDRVVRYFAYLPGVAASRTRLTAKGFLHDLVLMLKASGLSAGERELPSEDIDTLRKQLAELLDAANRRFEDKIRRTIIIVDGLDHVDCDYSGHDSLLGELPRPGEIPDGVIFVVGSRMLSPLHAHIRYQIMARGALVDLQEYPLSSASVLEICRRASITAHLPDKTHQTIVELSNGHPLALSYLLNRVADTGDMSADDLLSSVPPYEGDIAAQYLAVWDQCEDESELVDVLSVCSRLRVSFTMEWLSEWTSEAAVRAFRQKVLYLFRRHHGELRFFHDSFRQFAADRTALGHEERPDANLDARVHRRIAELCAQSEQHQIASEQLFHRYCAGQHDAALDLATPMTFREQYQRRRSPDLIRDDIGHALAIAADREDILVMVRLLLALVEVGQRTSYLEEVDMAGLLYTVGLHDEAVAWCGSDARRVSPIDALGLATKLQRAGNPAGRSIFDLIGNESVVRTQRVGRVDNAAAAAWVRAAVLFRPLQTVIGAIKKSLEFRKDEESTDKYRIAERWRCYRAMFGALIESVSSKLDESAAIEIDVVLAEHLKQLRDYTLQPDESDEDRQDKRLREFNIATLVDLRFRAQAILFETDLTAEAAEVGFKHLCSMLNDVPVFHTTRLDAAEIFARYEKFSQAMSLLDGSRFCEALTVDALGHNNDVGVIDRHFRYWKLRYFLASDPDEVPESVPPSSETPAGNSVTRGAPLHEDVEAIEMATRIDAAVRALARLDAAICAGQVVSIRDAWATLFFAVEVFSPAHHRSRANYHRIGPVRSRLMQVVIDVAHRANDELIRRLIEVLAVQFERQPDRWPLVLRLDLADYLRSTGANVPWYEKVLADYEEGMAAEDVHSKLDFMAKLVHRYMEEGKTNEARQLVDRLVPMAFGVGYREDDQFDSWVSWLGRVLAEQDGEQFIDEAVWLARVLTAVEPMTDGAPGTAAAKLPAAVATASPIAAVRIFEFLVRCGTVRHVDALAALTKALVDSLEVDGALSVRLAADMIADLIARAGTRPYPELAASLVLAAERMGERTDAVKLAESVASRTDVSALPTTRKRWRQGLGLEGVGDRKNGHDSTPNDSGTSKPLVLSGGQEMEHGSVVASVRSADDIISLYSEETSDSSFSWPSLLEETKLSTEDTRALIPAFSGEAVKRPEILLSIAEAAERSGDEEAALEVARVLLRTSRSESWSRKYGASRRFGAAMAIRLGGDEDRREARRNLAQELRTNHWLPGLLLDELDSLLEVLDPGLSPASIWPEIRAYLAGMSESLDLPDPDVLADHGCRWWLPAPSGDRRIPGDAYSAGVALAELVVGHLSHPTQVFRDGATTIVIRALTVGNEDVEGALARFAQPDASEDTLERAGRCLAGARVQDSYIVPEILQPLELTLESHRSQVLRDLCPSRSPRAYRPISPLYRLVLPAPVDSLVGVESVFLAPHEWQYEILADELDIDRDTLLAVAARYASEALSALPEEKAVGKALDAAGIRHTCSYQKVAASRAAFGRVLADLNDARLLDNLPPRFRHSIRTFDVDLIRRGPVSRPSVVADPPEAGVGHTISRWRDQIESRLEEYIGATTQNDRVLVGGCCSVTILNWGLLEEEFVCGSTIGAAVADNGNILSYRRSAKLGDLISMSGSRFPEKGEPLVFQNVSPAFHQSSSDWLSFRPDLAAELAWTPDAARPGCWYTASGELAVESTWWMDGWSGSGARAFDDTVAEGFTVALTPYGLADIEDKFGSATRHFELTRFGLDDGIAVDPVSISCSRQDIGAEG